MQLKISKTSGFLQLRRLRFFQSSPAVFTFGLLSSQQDCFWVNEIIFIIIKILITLRDQSDLCTSKTIYLQ